MSIIPQNDFEKALVYGGAKKPSESMVWITENFVMTKEVDKALVVCDKALDITLFDDVQANGTIHQIRDIKKTANTNNITVKVPTGWYLNGVLNGTLTMNTAGAKVDCIPNGAKKEWWVG